MKHKIKGVYVILIGVLFFVLGKFLAYRFPNDITALAVGVCAETSLWIFLGIGIITVLRERKENIEKNQYKKSVEKVIYFSILDWFLLIGTGFLLFFLVLGIINEGMEKLFDMGVFLVLYIFFISMFAWMFIKKQKS